MGCDIHSYAEVRKEGRWTLVGDVFPLSKWDAEYYKKTHSSEPFPNRSYGLFGFLADVRNYSSVPVLKPVSYSLPEDVSPEVKEAYGKWDMDAHSASSITLREFLDFDYEQTFSDVRSGVEVVSVREFLRAEFFTTLDILKGLGEPDDVRVVFWFDN